MRPTIRALLLISSLIWMLSGCSPLKLPVDTEVKKLFTEHRQEFEDIKGKLLSEQTPSFSIDVNGNAKSIMLDATKRIYFDLVDDKLVFISGTTDKPMESILPCVLLMKKLGIGQVTREGSSVHFKVGQMKVGKFLKEKYLVYDQSGFNDPRYKIINEPRQGSTYVELEPHWAVNQTWLEMGYEKKSKPPGNS